MVVVFFFSRARVLRVRMSAFVQGRSFATFFAILISESLSRQTIQSQSGGRQYYALRGVRCPVIKAPHRNHRYAAFSFERANVDRIITAHSRSRSFIRSDDSTPTSSDAERLIVHRT